MKPETESKQTYDNLKGNTGIQLHERNGNMPTPSSTEDIDNVKKKKARNKQIRRNSRRNIYVEII